MELKLQLDDELAVRLKTLADKRHQVIQKVAIDILDQAASSGNLEQRQFIGRIISGREILQRDGLVLISGIYYRYQIADHQKVVADRNYEIINSDGNLIFLKERA